MENKLKDALSKAKEADKAKAQVKDLIRDAEDSEKFVIAAQIGAYAKLKDKNVTIKKYIDKNKPLNYQYVFTLPKRALAEKYKNET